MNLKQEEAKQKQNRMEYKGKERMRSHFLDKRVDVSAVVSVSYIDIDQVGVPINNSYDSNHAFTTCANNPRYGYQRREHEQDASRGSRGRATFPQPPLPCQERLLLSSVLHTLATISSLSFYPFEVMLLSRITFQET